MQALGFDVWRYQFVAFVLSAAFAGLAGALYAYYNRFVGPEYLHVIQSAEALIMVILGGAGTLIGPAIGAGADRVPRGLISARMTQHWVLVLGIIYVLVTLFAPRGLIGLVNDIRQRRSAQMTALTVDNVSKNFGGVAALSGVSLDIEPGERRVLLGPERRRQDDTVSHHLRQCGAVRRPHQRCSATTSRGCGRTGARGSASPAPSRSPICSRG